MVNRNIKISDEIFNACPVFCAASIECNITNTLFNEILWYEIEQFSKEFTSRNKMGDIKKRPAIHATREVYKKLGKDPNRYRPSGEALCRRILKNQELYKINTVVDLINLISLKTGYSIGGFDADKIKGDLVLGVGEAGERFEAIGRGFMNIEGLPVYRDSIGGIGTPTSDEERTKITATTSSLLMLINGYSGKNGLTEAVEYSTNLLLNYAHATGIKTRLLNSKV